MLEVYLETNTNNIACLGGEGCGVWDGRGAGNVCGLQIDVLFVAPQLVLLQLLQDPPTPGIHHGISVALFLSIFFFKSYSSKSLLS